MITKLKPWGARILAEYIPEVGETKTQGGIIVPTFADNGYKQAKVLAVGSHVIANGEVIQLPAKPGDTVIYSKNAGVRLTVNNQEYLVLGDHEILAVLETEVEPFHEVLREVVRNDVPTSAMMGGPNDTVCHPRAHDSTPRKAKYGHGAA